MAKVYKRTHLHRVTYYAHFSHHGKRFRIKLDAQNMVQAKKMATEVEYRILAENYQILNKSSSITLRDLADRYLEYAKSNKRSWDRDVVSLKNILNMVIDKKKLGDYTIDAIRVAYVQKYQILRKKELSDRYAAKGIAAEDQNFATCNRELACLRHIFNMAIEWELLRKNPVVSRVVRFDKERSRDRTLDDQEFTALLQACSGHLLRIVLVALNTGMRLGEILSLKWENVGLDKQRIEIKHSKTGEGRIIPMNSFLIDVFKSMPRNDVYLFMNRDGKKIGSIKTAWNNTTKKAGIEDLRFHDLRHTVASRLARAKVPESVIAMILGHKRTSITSRYINPHWEEMVEAVEELGKLCHGYGSGDEKLTRIDDSN